MRVIEESAASAPRPCCAPHRVSVRARFISRWPSARFASPDDCEALALCQRGYASTDGHGWNDLSKGYANRNPQVDDEAQMRAFWREWQQRLHTAPA
jgi:p-cumate 2,3-dioxygenase alpha subunit